MAKIDPEISKVFHDVRNSYQAFLFHFKEPDCKISPEDAIAMINKDLVLMREAEQTIREKRSWGIKKIFR